jgi:hypothetical protein
MRQCGAKRRERIQCALTPQGSTNLQKQVVALRCTAGKAARGPTQKGNGVPFYIWCIGLSCGSIHRCANSSTVVAHLPRRREGKPGRRSRETRTKCRVFSPLSRLRERGGGRGRACARARRITLSERPPSPPAPLPFHAHFMGERGANQRFASGHSHPHAVPTRKSEAPYT